MANSFRVQRGVAVIGQTGVGPHTVTLGIAADATRAFPRLTNTLISGAGRDVASNALLSNRDLGAVLENWTGADFTLERATGAELVDHRYVWEVLEDTLPDDLRPAHGLYVRALASARLLAGVVSFPTPTAVSGIVDASRAFLWPLSRRSAHAGQEGSDVAMTAYLTGANKVQVDRGQALATANLSYAVLELGSAWTVRRLTLSTATRGADVPIPGCGSEPWANKFYIATWRAPAGADQLADIPLLRASPTNPDELLYFNPTGGTAGTFDLSVYVIHHPGLAVQHWSVLDSPAYGDLPAVEVDWLIEIPQSVAGYEDSVSILDSATNTGPNQDYPKMHLGYTLEPGGAFVRWRRGRPPGRPTQWALQSIRWPAIPQGSAHVAIGHTATSRQLG